MNSYYLAALVPPWRRCAAWAPRPAWHRVGARPCAAGWPFSTAATVAVTVALCPATWASAPGSSARPWWSGSSLSSSSSDPSARATPFRLGPRRRPRRSPRWRCCSARPGPRPWWSGEPQPVRLALTRRPPSTPTPRRRPTTFPLFAGAPRLRRQRPAGRGRRRLRDLAHDRLLHPRHRARVPPRRRIHRGRARAVTPRIQAVGRRGPRPPGNRHDQPTDKRTRPALGGGALHEAGAAATTRWTQATRTVYLCVPRDAAGASRAVPLPAPLHRSRPCGSRGTASPA